VYCLDFQALDADDPSCWSRTAALLCKYVGGEPGRADEARALAAKLGRLHACGGRCRDVLLARAVGEAEAEGPVAEEVAADAPPCALLDAEVWAKMRESEPLKRELQASWGDEDLARQAGGGVAGGGVVV